ncbi:MAG: hypothetical protein GDA43_09265 [Hormoscilla sp. SP5CHS1]|nr:hypothetical protein [Hormoscilla sp. SP5CHS1]
MARLRSPFAISGLGGEDAVRSHLALGYWSFHDTTNSSVSRIWSGYSLFRKKVEHFCAKLELYSMQTQFSYGTLLSGP